MVIETAFNIGDNLWFMYDNKPWCKETLSVGIVSAPAGITNNKKKSSIKYVFYVGVLDNSDRNSGDGYIKITEQLLYRTKLDLLFSFFTAKEVENIFKTKKGGDTPGVRKK